MLRTVKQLRSRDMHRVADFRVSGSSLKTIINHSENSLTETHSQFFIQSTNRKVSSFLHVKDGMTNSKQ